MKRSASRAIHDAVVVVVTDVAGRVAATGLLATASAAVGIDRAAAAVAMVRAALVEARRIAAPDVTHVEQVAAMADVTPGGCAAGVGAPAAAAIGIGDAAAAVA